MQRAPENLEEDLRGIVRASPWFMNALGAVRSLHIESWCIGAGAVRNLVWDHLHGYSEPSAFGDVDVAYFNANDLGQETDADIQRKLVRCVPHLPWEVTNQAAVHLWFEGHFGHPVSPLRSLEEAVASWPEYATSVGIAFNGDAQIEIISPHGLQDLFDMRIQRNPIRVSAETYRQRIQQKQYTRRWPRVTILPC